MASPAQHSTAQHIQHSTHSTAQHSTAQHSTAQHSTFRQLTKRLVQVTAFSVSCLVVLPSFFQDAHASCYLYGCYDDDGVFHFYPVETNPPADDPWDWGGGFADPNPPTCDYLGDPDCDDGDDQDDGGGENSDPEPEPEPEPDIQCFVNTTVIGPLTVMETLAAQSSANSLDGFIAGLFGTAVGSVVSVLGGSVGGSAAAGLITGYIVDYIFDNQSNYHCGLIITTTTRVCTGSDISQMGMPALSDFWGDNILTVETSSSTGVCVNDFPSGGGVEP